MSHFYRFLKKILSSKVGNESNTLEARDFNVILKASGDGKGTSETFSINEYKDVVNVISEVTAERNLNTWRTRNPYTHTYTWRQRNAPLYRRLQYWLILKSTFDSVKWVDVIPGYTTDH